MFLALQEEEILFFVQLSQPQVSQGDRVARRGFHGMAGFSELPELPEFPKRAFTARQVSQKIQNFQKGFHGMAGLNSLFTGKMHHVQKCFTRKEQ